jgi:hypothetical protein
VISSLSYIVYSITGVISSTELYSITGVISSLVMVQRWRYGKYLTVNYIIDLRMTFGCTGFIIRQNAIISRRELAAGKLNCELSCGERMALLSSSSVPFCFTLEFLYEKNPECRRCLFNVKQLCLNWNTYSLEARLNAFLFIIMGFFESSIGFSRMCLLANLMFVNSAAWPSMTSLKAP